MQTRRKRDSVELDVQSMSESLLENSLSVHMRQTSKTPSENTSLGKMNTEDDIKMNFEMQEKMEAAKKAWDLQEAKSNVSAVSKEESTDTSQDSVVDHRSRSSNVVEEGSSSDSLVKTPRLKKATSGEQQNVCKVKPQQQQQPVKPETVSNESSEVYNTAMPILDNGAQSYAITQHQAAIFSSKSATPNFMFPFEQQSLVPMSHRYVQTDMSSIQQQISPLRPQNMHPASQSPPQHSVNYPTNQHVSTPSPLPHQPLVQDRHIMPTPALYSTNAFTGSPFFSMPVIRATTPQFHHTTVTDDMNNSIYAVQAPKAQSTGYETSVPAGQQVFLPVEQHSFQEYIQTRQPHVEFYGENQGSSGGVDPAHRHQQQADSRLTSGHTDQRYTPPDHSEMSKHVHAKPFQPPSSSPPGIVSQQIGPDVNHLHTVDSQANATTTYHVNGSMLSLQRAGQTIQCTVSSGNQTGTSPMLTQTQGMTVSRIGYPPYPAAIGSFQRQLPVHHLSTASFPTTALAYRAHVPNFSTTTSVGGNTASGMMVPKSAPVMRQIITSGRTPTIAHQMPEPIQRPNKVGFHAATVNEKQSNSQARLKVAPNRRFNTAGVPSAPIRAYQFQTSPMAQVATAPQQQQQNFRSQQHQLMMSNTQQFFAEEKEHQRKQKLSSQKSLIVSAASGSANSGETLTTNENIEVEKRRQPTKTETKPQKSTKDDQQKRRRQAERKPIRTAQITPQRQTNRPPNKARPSVVKPEDAKNAQLISPGTIPPSKIDTIDKQPAEVHTASI